MSTGGFLTIPRGVVLEKRSGVHVASAVISLDSVAVHTHPEPSSDSSAHQPDLRYHGDIAAIGSHLDFAVNVRPATPQWLVDDLRAEFERPSMLRDYPDRALAVAAREAIASMHGVNPACVLLLNGGAEGFALLGRLAPQHPVVVHPSFTEPEALLLSQGFTVERAYTSAAQQWRLPDIPHEADMVIVGNPTNPTGRVHTRDELCRLIVPGRVVVVDEAFMDVTDGTQSMVDKAAQGECIVLRSLTKTFALAGLRCGYLVADPHIVEQLEGYRPAWPLTNLQHRALISIAKRGNPYIHQQRQIIAEEKRNQVHALREEGFCVHMPTSPAPFMLVEPSCEEPQLRLRNLARSGVSVRPCDSFPGLGSNFWRLAVRDPASVQLLLEAYRSV